MTLSFTLMTRPLCHIDVCDACQSALNVGFPSQLKKGVDKHHLFLDLCCHLSRDSRGLILEVKSERAFAHLTITFMKNHVATWSCANAISFHVWIWNKYPKPISIFCGNWIWWITYSLYICDGQSNSLKLKYTYKCKRMSSIGILLTYTTNLPWRDQNKRLLVKAFVHLLRIWINRLQ